MPGELKLADDTDIAAVVAIALSRRCRMDTLMG